MVIYIYNIIVVILLGILFLNLTKSNLTKKIYFSIVTLQMALIAGLRGYNIGWDTRNYVWFFSRAANYDFWFIITNDVELEKGYVILEHLVSLITNNPSVLFFIIALFYYISVSRFIYKYSKEPVVSYVIFISIGFFTFAMTALRQAIALAIILFAIDYIKKRKLLPFLIIVGLASTFHISALIFIPAYFIAYKKFSKVYIILSISAIPIVFYLRYSIFNFANRITRIEYSSIDTAGPITLTIIMILVFIISLVRIKKILNRSDDNIILYNFTYISILSTMIAFVHPAALRAAFYYMFSILLFIPEIIASFRCKITRIYMYLMIFVLLLIMYINGLNPSSPFVPYQFLWQ